MIKWNLIDPSSLAITAKIIKDMSFDEFEYILHTKLEKIILEITPYIRVERSKIKMLKDAVNHYTELKKLDVTYRRRKENRKDVHPKIELVRFGADGNFIETWLINDKTNKREKKICGRSTKGYRPWFVCKREAGYKTSHPGYGLCWSCEMKENNETRVAFWTNLRANFSNVPTLVELVDKAEQTDRILHDTLDGDVAYLELAREALMQAANAGGILTKEMRQDLTVITDIMTRVKERKVKLQQMNWIPPEQVGALILQVLTAVTNGEDDSVKARIAARAKDLTNILIPRIEDNNVFMDATVTDLKKGTETASKYIKRPIPVVRTEIIDGVSKRRIDGEEVFPWTMPIVNPNVEEPKKESNYNHSWRKKTSAANFDEVRKPSFPALIKKNDAPSDK